jgi:hypothetical protein
MAISQGLGSETLETHDMYLTRRVMNRKLVTPAYQLGTAIEQETAIDGAFRIHIRPKLKKLPVHTFDDRAAKQI